MDERFATLAQWLSADTPSAFDTLEAAAIADAPDLTSEEPQVDEMPNPFNDVLSSARHVRAALEDAIEMIRADLVTDIAAEIIGRELRLAPVEINAIIERAVARYGGETPCIVRANPDDVERITLGVKVVPDQSLRSGDVVIEVRSGSIDARLGIRLERVLRHYA